MGERKSDWKPGDVTNDYREGHEAIFGPLDIFANLADKAEEAQDEIPKPQ